MVWKLEIQKHCKRYKRKEPPKKYQLGRKQERIIKTVIDVITEYLKSNGYDGLCFDDCGCGMDDLVPCGNDPSLCIGAYKCDCNPDHSFYCETQCTGNCDTSGREY